MKISKYKFLCNHINKQMKIKEKSRLKVLSGFYMKYIIS